MRSKADETFVIVETLYQIVFTVFVHLSLFNSFHLISYCPCDATVHNICSIPFCFTIISLEFSLRKCYNFAVLCQGWIFHPGTCYSEEAQRELLSETSIKSWSSCISLRL